MTLITDPKSAVSAIVQESRAEGVVAGNYDASLNMEFVGQGAAVKEGDFVLTSGVGGGYPAGIVIGRVSTVQKTEQDLFQKVSVDHLASLSNIEHVLVLTSFEPQQAGAAVMRYWTGAGVAFFLALLQASSIEQFKVLGVTPNLLLVLLVSWLVVRGLDDVLPMIAVAGVTLGFVGLQTPGLVLLALLPIAGLGVLREMHVIHSDLLLVLAFVARGDRRRTSRSSSPASMAIGRRLRHRRRRCAAPSCPRPS